MKLHFVGTSHGVPSATRFCSCSIIETQGRLYVFDVGAPLTESILKMGFHPSDVKAIFTTHSHADHVSGLCDYCTLVGWYYLEHSLPVHITETDLGDAIKNFYLATSKHELPDRIKFVTVDKNFVYDDGFIKISYIPTNHLWYANRPSYSILVEVEGRRVLLSGDFSNNLSQKDVPVEVLKTPLDAFVCELAHFSFEELAPYLSGCNAKTIFFNHIFPLDKIEDINKNSGKFVSPFVVVSDGDVFEI